MDTALDSAGSGGSSGSGSAGDVGTVVLANRSDTPLIGVYVRSGTQTSLGPNLLVGRTLAPGQSISTTVTAGYISVKFEGEHSWTADQGILVPAGETVVVNSALTY